MTQKGAGFRLGCVTEEPGVAGKATAGGRVNEGSLSDEVGRLVECTDVRAD